MKLLLVFTLLFSFSLFAQNRVIYGSDSRVDVYESKDVLFNTLSRSTVALMKIGKSLIPTENGDYTLHGKKFGKAMGLCKEERFFHQPSFGFCSGTLIGPDLILTAGHCINSIRDCEETAFVFDFKMNSKNEFSKVAKKDNVYRCKKIISVDPGGDKDHAVIQLRRMVKKRIPLSMRKEGEIKQGDKLIVIGHPSGIPTKIADGYTRYSPHRDYFMTNLDTYGGNSGSAVFNYKTGMIEGILVRGARDFIRAPGKSCYISNVCKEDECGGEAVTRVSSIKHFEKIQDRNQSFYRMYPKARAYYNKVYGQLNLSRPYYRSRYYRVRNNIR